VSRITPASAKFVLAGLVACVLVTTQAACSARSGTDAAAPAADPGEQRAIDDNVIKLELNRRLIDDGLGLFKDVTTVVFGGRVLLIGSVGEPESVARAGTLAQEIAGVQEVINEIQTDDTGGIGAFISDVIIEKSIQSSLLFDDAIDSTNFRVRSVNGVVYMIGQAANQSEYDRATAVVSETTDVRQIVNYVLVSPE